MKNLGLILLSVIALMVSLASCGDACQDVTCQNGGICDNGACDCPTGYSGTLCEIEDACLNITCLNGGTCDDGTCDCPTGFGGATCADTLPSTSMIINKITVTNYPATRSNGQSWDATDGADAFVSFNIGTVASNSGYSSETINNVTGSNLTFNNNLPTNTGGAHNIDWVIGLWDEDATGNELMSSIAFRPDSKGDGNPSSITLTSGDMTVELEVTWEY